MFLTCSYNYSRNLYQFLKKLVHIWTHSINLFSIYFINYYSVPLTILIIIGANKREKKLSTKVARMNYLHPVEKMQTLPFLSFLNEEQNIVISNSWQKIHLPVTMQEKIHARRKNLLFVGPTWGSFIRSVWFIDAFRCVLNEHPIRWTTFWPLSKGTARPRDLCGHSVIVMQNPRLISFC